MDSKEASDRVIQLIADSERFIKSNELAKASDALREASHLDPGNEQLKPAWQNLHDQESHAHVVELIRLYLGSGKDEDGQKALDALRAKRLPGDVATEVVNLLLHSPEELKFCDALTGTILGRNEHARKSLALRFAQSVIELFEQLYARGDDSFTAFASLALDKTAWASEEKQLKAQEDVFQLSVAKLIDAGVEKPERAMRAIARQLASEPGNVKQVIDGDVFGVILSCLDIRLSLGLRSQAILATSKLLEVMGDLGGYHLRTFITNKVAHQTSDDLVLAFSAAAALFPVVPPVMGSLFMTDGFVQQLVPNLERNSTAVREGKLKSERLEQAALELLSAACVDKACREAIDRYCSHWLKNIANDREGTHKALAALVLAKINTLPDEADIVSKLVALAIDGGGERDQAIEGLAYASLRPTVKEDIIKDQRLLQSIVKALHDRPSAVFGSLTILNNLTSYKIVLSEEQRRVSELRAYAASQKPSPEDPLDDNSHVSARCRIVLDADAVPALVASCKRSSSPTIAALTTRILLALAKEQKHRAKMSQQGAVRLLLQIHDRIAKTDKSTSEAANIERDASHALARLLISVNPAHVFTSGLPASSAVSALVPLLSIDSDSDTRDLLPTFEALLALTNLASMEDNSVRELLIRLSWTRIEDLLLASNSMVQRATVELVCNLMASPTCVSKFADGSNDAKRRMHVLLALGDANDLATRRAAGGALAMLTEWDAAVSAVLDKDIGVKILLAMCKDESEDMKHRGFVSIGNVISAPGDVGRRALEKVRGEGGDGILTEQLKTTRNPEVLQIGVEVLKQVRQK